MGLTPFSDPEIGLNRFLVLLTIYLFEQKIFFIPLSMSGKVLEGGKKKFCNRPKIGDFWPKFGDFGALFKNSKIMFPPYNF